MTSSESQLEDWLIAKLQDLKYEHRPDIRDRAALEKNSRDRFNTLNHVKLTEGEFTRLLDEIVTPDVFAASHTLRNRNAFTGLHRTTVMRLMLRAGDKCREFLDSRMRGLRLDHIQADEIWTFVRD